MGLSRQDYDSKFDMDYVYDDDVINVEEDEEDCPTIALTKEEKAC